MRRLLKQKKNLKIVSAVLVLSMVIGLLGTYPIVSQAAETVTLADFYASDDFTVADNPEGGVQVTHNAGIVQYSCLTTSTTYDVTQGVHFDVEGITAPYEDGYSFIVHMGFADATGLNYAQSTITLAISSNGNYKVWRTSVYAQESNPEPSKTDIMIDYGTLENPPTGNKLSFDIKVLETGKYELAIEGNETITLTEPGTPWFPMSDFKTAKFGFQIWPSIVDTTTYSTRVWEKPASAGATYVIKDISKTVVEVQEVSVNTSNLNLLVDGTAQLSATVSPANADNVALTWASDNEDVATVDQNGKVTAVAEGTANITATAVNGVKGICMVGVYDEIPSGVITKSDLTNRGNVVLKEVNTGVEITQPAADYSSLIMSMYPHAVDRGLLYRVTDIKKTDESASGSYSIAVTIGNATRWDSNQIRMSSQWYDQKGYIVLYGKSGNFAILKLLNSNQNNLVAGRYETIVAEKIEPLGDNLSLYVKEEGNNWTITVNGSHHYTFNNENVHSLSGNEYWFNVNAFSDFTVTATNPIEKLNYWGSPTDNQKCEVTYTVSTIAPTVPTLFTDGMMFQQNKPMNVWGYGIPGQTATAKLYDNAGTLLETKTAKVLSTGRWDVSFTARQGGYDTYKMDIQVGDHTDQTKAHQVIQDILIGELWVSSGQSNMELSVKNDMDVEQILANATNSNLRFYLEPLYPFAMKGSQPAYPALDVPQAYWGYGNCADDVKGVSAVAYTFAKTLQEELNVPVGIINTAIGGTYIEGWLSRKAIEGNSTVKDLLNQYGSPYSSKWYYDVEQLAQNAGEMSTLYNGKIGPLEGMNVAGTIWYQGESNEWASEIYGKELELLKRSWSKAFGYENEDMPFIFTQVAPYQASTSTTMVKGYLALYMEQAWKSVKEKNTAMLTLYDLPLEHMKDGASTHPIHPRTKVPVGERFALAAMNMVYSGGDEYTAPVYKDMDIRDNAIYVTFDRVGNNGLKTTDGTSNLHGFTIAGADGVFVNAKAEIVDEDTVKVWSDYILNPKNVIYAFSDMNQGANLCGSVGIPAAPFRTVALNDTVGNPNASLQYFVAQDWMYADKDVWVCTQTGDDLADYYKYQPSFAVTGGSYTYDSATKAEGTASLKVTYTDDFKVSPILTYHSIQQDWSKFNYLAVRMKNTDAVKVAMKITSGGQEYTVPTDLGSNTAELSGSDEFKEIAFDFTGLDDAVLAGLTNVSFEVTAENAGEMYFDDFVFGMQDTKDRTNPVISGVTDHAEYCADVEFSVVDDNLDKVTVNGTVVVPTQGKYTLKAENVNGTEYTIIAKDNEGNTTTVIVTVYKGHSYSNYVSDNNATTEADGTKTAVCDRGCGSTDTMTDAGSKLPDNKVDQGNKNNQNNKDNQSDKNNQGDKKESPKTGDSCNVFVWFTLLIASIIAFFGVGIYRKKVCRCERRSEC